MTMLEELSGAAARLALNPESVVVVPIGAVEEHGPHLPLAVDHIIATEVAQAASESLDGSVDIHVLPTLPFSKSNEHAWSPGTIWLSNDTMMRIIADIGACVASAGCRRIAFLNGHGGNTALLQVACRELRLAHGLLTFLLHPFVGPAYTPASASPTDHPVDECGMGIHGGHEETSVMLHLRPDLVDMSKATRNVPEWLLENTHVRFGGEVAFGWLSNDFGPDGHIGDPTAATAESGREFFDYAVARVCAQLAEIVTFDFPDKAPATKG